MRPDAISIRQRSLWLDKQSQLDAVRPAEVTGMERERGEEGGRFGGGGVSWRADVPDSVNVLDGVADLLAELFLIELHLRRQTETTGTIKCSKILKIQLYTHKNINNGWITRTPFIIS